MPFGLGFSHLMPFGSASDTGVDVHDINHTDKDINDLSTETISSGNVNVIKVKKQNWNFIFGFSNSAFAKGQSELEDEEEEDEESKHELQQQSASVSDFLFNHKVKETKPKHNDQEQHQHDSENELNDADNKDQHNHDHDKVKDGHNEKDQKTTDKIQHQYDENVKLLALTDKKKDDNNHKCEDKQTQKVQDNHKDNEGFSERKDLDHDQLQVQVQTSKRKGHGYFWNFFDSKQSQSHAEYSNFMFGNSTEGDGEGIPKDQGSLETETNDAISSSKSGDKKKIKKDDWYDIDDWPEEDWDYAIKKKKKAQKHKTKLCKYFLKGICVFGDECRNKHAYYDVEDKIWNVKEKDTANVKSKKKKDKKAKEQNRWGNDYEDEGAYSDYEDEKYINTYGEDNRWNEHEPSKNWQESNSKTDNWWDEYEPDNKWKKSETGKDVEEHSWVEQEVNREKEENEYNDKNKPQAQAQYQQQSASGMQYMELNSTNTDEHQLQWSGTSMMDAGDSTNTEGMGPCGVGAVSMAQAHQAHYGSVPAVTGSDSGFGSSQGNTTGATWAPTSKEQDNYRDTDDEVESESKCSQVSKEQDEEAVSEAQRLQLCSIISLKFNDKKQKEAQAAAVSSSPTQNWKSQTFTQSHACDNYNANKRNNCGRGSDSISNKKDNKSVEQLFWPEGFDHALLPVPSQAGYESFATFQQQYKTYLETIGKSKGMDTQQTQWWKRFAYEKMQLQKYQSKIKNVKLYDTQTWYGIDIQSSSEHWQNQGQTQDRNQLQQANGNADLNHNASATATITNSACCGSSKLGNPRHHPGNPNAPWSWGKNQASSSNHGHSLRQNHNDSSNNNTHAKLKSNPNAIVSLSSKPNPAKASPSQPQLTQVQRLYLQRIKRESEMVTLAAEDVLSDNGGGQCLLTYSEFMQEFAMCTARISHMLTQDVVKDQNIHIDNNNKSIKQETQLQKPQPIHQLQKPSLVGQVKPLVLSFDNVREQLVAEAKQVKKQKTAGQVDHDKEARSTSISSSETKAQTQPQPQPGPLHLNPQAKHYFPSFTTPSVQAKMVCKSAGYDSGHKQDQYQ